MPAKFDAKTFNPVAFGKYVDAIPRVRMNALITSRALSPNEEIRTAFNGEQTGKFFAVLPFFGRLDGAPQNYDGATDIEPGSTTTYERGVVVTGRARAWTEKDFSHDVTGGVDFMGNVARQTADYWQDVDQDTLLAVLQGIFAMNTAKNQPFVDNHTYDITGGTDDAALVGPTTLNTATQKACGDNKGSFSLVVMHSVVATRLENLNVLEFLKFTDSNGIQRNLTLADWNGRTVLIDDGMPCVEVPETTDGAGDGYTAYTTYVLGDGAIDYENVGVKEPYEMGRDPRKNGGEDTLYTRQRKVFAPFGISFTKAQVASFSPTDEELKLGKNWALVSEGTGAAAKVIPHKAIPIARIISKG
ncbi:MAG: phage coat protein [Oscillospiraceae bacterium]|nr:phage coat protein [Oscillospiraceae bacterium]